MILLGDFVDRNNRNGYIAPMEQPIEKIKLVLGSQAALADALDVSRMTVTRWRGRIPAERVLPIYHATEGQISPHEMRPDIYPDPAWRP